MTIELDAERTPQIPVVSTREIGQTVTGMVVDKWVRDRQKKDGTPIVNKKTGKVSKEEVLVILVMDGTTGTVSVGSGLDAETHVPAVGEVSRLIYKGLGYSKLIEARRDVGGGTQVGDVISQTGTSATIWRGEGDIERAGVTDPNVIAKARAGGLSVGIDIDVTYRRATAAEAGFVAKAEQLYHERKAAIPLDNPRSAPAEELEPF